MPIPLTIPFPTIPPRKALPIQFTQTKPLKPRRSKASTRSSVSLCKPESCETPSYMVQRRLYVPQIQDNIIMAFPLLVTFLPCCDAAWSGLGKTHHFALRVEFIQVNMISASVSSSLRIEEEVSILPCTRPIRAQMVEEKKTCLLHERHSIVKIARPHLDHSQD